MVGRIDVKVSVISQPLVEILCQTSGIPLAVDLNPTTDIFQYRFGQTQCPHVGLPTLENTLVSRSFYDAAEGHISVISK